MAAFHKLVKQAVKAARGVEDLPENEIERKFCSLALAFKTDKQTLDKRKGIQERSRDLAEANVETEIKGLQDAAKEMNQVVTDAKLRDVIQKIQSHIEVLMQSTARVSSRAEVLGAVQQENRMSIAMEIMIAYVNHLKTLYEKEHIELEDARRVLQDKPFGNSSYSSLGHTNRSMSVAGLNVPHKHSRQRSRSPSPGAGSKDKTRRRSEVALPRMCGGVGSPMLKQSASLEIPLFMDLKLHGSGIEAFSGEDEDPKQRFQALVGTTQMRNTVASQMRRSSLDRQASAAQSPPNSVTPSRENSTGKPRDATEKTPSNQASQEEDAYKKGFQDGVKANLGHKLSELRDKQNQIGNSMEDVMDKVEKYREEEEREKEEAAEKRLMQMRALGLHKPNWNSKSQSFRLALAGLIFMMAIGMVIMTILPGSASGLEAHVNVHYFGTPPV